jgi:hypothetical protein
MAVLSSSDSLKAVVYKQNGEHHTTISLIDSKKEMSLQRIFSHLTGDPHFLITITRTKNSGLTTDPKAGFFWGHETTDSSDSIQAMRSNLLNQIQTQDFGFFPKKLQDILPSNSFIKKGIRHRIEKVVNVRQNDPTSKGKFKIVSVRRNVNVSFLNSLNMILVKECREANELDQDLFLDSFEKFIATKITKNYYHIDKDTNTKKMQEKNKNLLELMGSEFVSETLIQIIINIFELNLLVYDVINDRCYFYWARGKTYPHVNLFNRLVFMTRTDGVYEPIIATANVDIDMDQQTYVKILTDERIQAVPEIDMNLQNYEYISSWGDNITAAEYAHIFNRYFDHIQDMQP